MKIQMIENCAREMQRECKQVHKPTGTMSLKTAKQQFHNKIKKKKNNDKTWCSQDDNGKQINLLEDIKP